MESYGACDGLDLAELASSGKASSRELLDKAVSRAQVVKTLTCRNGPVPGVPFLLTDIVVMAGTPLR